MTARRLLLLLSLLLAEPAALAAQGLTTTGPVGVTRARPLAEPGAVVSPDARVVAPDDAPTPRWVRWGLVGAAAGAVTFPLLAGLGNGSSSTGQAVAGGALAGFVVIGGAVALWDALCAGDTSSRRAGLCGR